VRRQPEGFLVNDLKSSLSTLRLDRETVATSRGSSKWWLLPCVAAVVGGAVVIKMHGASIRFGAPELETVQPTVQGGATVSAGAPVLSTTGYVVARRKAIVSSKIQGRLAELRVDEGAKVKAGEVIARLEDADVRAQVRRARAVVNGGKAALVEEQRKLAQTRGLVEAGAVPREQLAIAESHVRIAEAALDQARADVGVQDATSDAMLIRAPFTGTVVKKMAEVGEAVAPLLPGANISTATGAIVAIADLETLEVETDVSESSLGKLKTGQPAEVTVDAFPDARYKAELRVITPIADRTKDTVLVRVAILKIDGAPQPKPEMAAKVTFLEPRAAEGAAPPARVVLVPRRAVARRGAQDVVFELRGERARAVPVVLGEARGELVTVEKGVTGSEVLVATPSETLNDGDSAKVKK
jgi:RND family efflux transporter MFP subunit